MNATTKNIVIGVATSVVAMVIFKKFFDKPVAGRDRQEQNETKNLFGF